MDKGTFIRTAGSTRLADRPFIQEMYYEDENRSFDNVVNKDIKVTEADIKSFCEDMKKEAQRNCLNGKDAEKVKTPTKNNLISWGISKVRNRGIANAFVYMNLIEQWGSGIPKILAQTKEYGLPEVEFIDMGIALRVNMYRALTEDEKQAIKTSDKKQATSAKDKRQTIKESDRRTIFAEYMSQHGASTTAEMAAFSGLSPQRTRAILSKMVDDGIIIAEGSNKARKYRLQ